MKIYTKVVIDIDSMQVIDEHSYQYMGKISECKVGGGGGGAVTTYPPYIQAEHQRWVQGNAGYIFPGNLSVSQKIAEGMGINPFTSHILINTHDVFVGAGSVVTDFISPYNRIKNFATYDIDTKYLEYTQITDPMIADAISQHSVILDDEYATKILPAFEAGMADINAVMSSAFVIGRGLLLDTKQKQVSKFTKDIQLQAFDWASKRVSLNMEMHRLLVTSSTEISRMYTAVRLEAEKEDFDLAEKDALWDLSLFQYGTQVMAAINGTATQSQKVPSQSKIAGALSGAMSGASAGAALGPYGAAAGGVAGAIGGLL